jgi:hypothetical protein
MSIHGGCLCGNLRYELSAEPIDAGFCHCTRCRRSSGAPVLAWLSAPFPAFRYTRGTPAIYESSPGFQREFCAGCGTQLAFRATVAPATIDLTLGSLDEIERIRPQYHIWCRSRVHWLAFDDGLPQYADAGPDIG